MVKDCLSLINIINRENSVQNVSFSFLEFLGYKLLIASTNKGICLVKFVDEGSNGLIKQAILRESKFRISIDFDGHYYVNQCKEELKDYFLRKRKRFTVSIDLYGTEFQRKVWLNLMTIPYGVKISYKQQSIDFGHQKAIRAIASANGKNNLAVIIPCHRVVGVNGALTGYRAGLQIKRKLLVLEGGLLDNQYQLPF